MVFDKTSTLTRGEQGLVTIATAGVSEDAALAAAVECDSELIVDRAIVAVAQERGLTLPEVRTIEALPGRGVQVTVDGRQFQVGS